MYKHNFGVVSLVSGYFRPLTVALLYSTLKITAAISVKSFPPVGTKHSSLFSGGYLHLAESFKAEHSHSLI